MENQNLERIIKDCKKGKSKAQENLYNLFAPKLLGVCLRYSNNMDDAEDTLQDGFIKIFQNIASYQFKGSFEGWMRRIMVNTALEKYRKTKNLKITEEMDYPEMNDEDYHVPTNVPLDILLNMIQELPNRYQMVFNLYVLDGYTHNEIAEVMNISSGTSKSNLARGRAILKDKVNKYFRDQDNNLKVC